jgi:hypothetical protein
MDRLASVTGLSFDNLSIAAGRTASDFPKTAAYGRSPVQQSNETPATSW